LSDHFPWEDPNDVSRILPKFRIKELICLYGYPPLPDEPPMDPDARSVEAAMLVRERGLIP